MLHRMTIFSLMVILVFFSTNVFSAQYENYKWGMSKQEAIKQVQETGHKIKTSFTLEKDGWESLEYMDILFNAKIRVLLFFTHESKKLCAIWIDSDDNSVGRALKPILTKKHGSPIQLNEFLEEYVWMDGGEPSLMLNYNYGTELIYVGDSTASKK